MSDVTVTGNQPNSKIKVFYDSVQVQNVRAVTITLWNAGNDFLSKDAFSKDKQITIECSKPVSILDLEALAISRPDLKFSALYHVDETVGTPTDTTTASSDYVTLEIQGDEGLEAGDGATFSILYTTNAVDCQWNVDARIKGIPGGFIKGIGKKYISEIYGSVLFYLFLGFMVQVFVKYVIAIPPQSARLIIRIAYTIVVLLSAYSLYAMLRLYPNSIDPPQILLP